MNGVDPVITFQIRKIKPSNQFKSRNVPFVSMIFELKMFKQLVLQYLTLYTLTLNLKINKDRLMSWPT